MKSFVRLLLVFVVACTGEQATEIRTDFVYPPVVQTYCGMCHATPEPSVLTRRAWPEKMSLMFDLLWQQRNIRLSEEDRRICLEFYVENAPEAFVALPPDTSDVARFFRKIPLGHPVRDSASRPAICNVAVGDLDQDRQPDILVCDAQYDVLSWIHQEGNRGVETPLAELKAPARSEVFDLEGDGDLDIVVALLGQLMPTDELLGEVVLLVNDGRESFTPFPLATGVPRVADVRPADLDGDGDWDFALAMFGWRHTGEVAWLEYKSGDQYNELHTLSSKSGCTHVPIGDLNGDGKPDIVALITQEFEQIVAFVNQGGGAFAEHVLFEARNPAFGSSGIELVDLDQDADLDILFTNGDGFDGTDAKPYHGVQWLENMGVPSGLSTGAALRFEYRDLTRFYGAYAANAGDLDLDGDLDIVVASCIADQSARWEDLPRQGLIWLENDGQQRFSRHSITSDPANFVTADLGDLDGDGRPDIITGGMHIFPPVPPPDHLGRVSLWLNRLDVDERDGE
ncbi:MAG: VCBS repeat-containing protein [Gemmatimonadetes bacterium]|nr:VCBS repeat-containing protein [Gemmatimonadota bacterium]MYB67233.1 VCBS repeat-containing protein [Gemmatimonadota bacterium]